MFRRVLPLVLSLVLVEGCSSDRAAFRPAKGATDQPALKEAFRVKAVTPDCVLLGYVTADGDRVLEDLAETAARHGGNSYLIVNENRDVRVATPDNNDLVSHTNRKMLAEVYRCMMSGDLPN